VKKAIKKLINKLIRFILLFVRSNEIKASIYTFFSKLLHDRNNKIEYDPYLNVYWLRSGTDFLFAVNEPYFNYSKKNLYKFLYDVYCKHYLPKEGDVIIDLGAGIGTETLFFYEKIKNQGRIYSIEASPTTIVKLNALCHKNKIENSINFNIAISNLNGKIWIEETEKFEVNQINTHQRGVEVTCFTLDQFVKDNSIRNIDFLKVNIEGAELEMISGMENTIKIVKNVAISCHDFLFEEDKHILKTVTSFLEINGFEVTYNNSGNKVIDSWIYGKRK
jgi:FkbM family methyltransferase